MPLRNDILRNARDQILERLIALLEDDPRVRAAWLSGSFGRGCEDDLSDLDLHVAVDDDQVSVWLASRPDLYARIGKPVMVRADKPSNAGPGPFQEVMFRGPVTLDLNVHPASTARRGIDTRLLFDRLPLPPRESSPLSDTQRTVDLQQTLEFFWAMASIALKHVARGHTQRAVTQLDLLLGAYVDAWRLIQQPGRRDAGGAHWLHPARDAELRELLPVLGADIDPRAVLDAISLLMNEITALHPNAERMGASVPGEAADEVTQFRNSMAGELPARSTPPPVTGGITYGD